MIKKLFSYITTIIFSCLVFVTVDIQAQQVLCVKKRLKAGASVRLSKGIKVAIDTCPKGFVQLLDTDSFKGDDGDAGPQGPVGPQGPAGSDANLQNLVYGDGSAGELVVDDASGDVSLTDQNLNFTNITVSAGRQLTISRGTTVRCTGTFTNEGTIDSLFSSQNTTFHTADTNTVDAFSAAWGASLFHGISKMGELALDGSIAAYGAGATGVIESAAAVYVNPPDKACGEGAPGSNQTGFCGQTIKIFCKGQIINSGTIDASAPNAAGGGGGSGGFVVLASQTGITNNGTISANGGNGGNSTTSSGPGGGGGGGVIHLLAPIIDGAGSTLVLGGSPGTDSGDTTANPRRGGSGGGGLGGSGGHGGTVNADNTVGTATSGSSGHSLTTVGDPTTLILQQINGK